MHGGVEMNQVHDLYQRFINAWNHRSAEDMAQQFTENGELIGFDGSEENGRSDILSHLKPIFVDHHPPPYVGKIKSVRFLNPDVAILRAIAGMVPPGKTEIEPTLNAHHTIVARKFDSGWLIELFQNTPAQFHGRPELVQQMTNELRMFSVNKSK
jgi:uncharacterized protein (TIGR02246 family)